MDSREDERYKDKRDKKKKEKSAAEHPIPTTFSEALNILRQENDAVYTAIQTTCQELQETTDKQAQQIELLKDDIRLLTESLTKQKSINRDILSQLEQCRTLLHLTNPKPNSDYSGKKAKPPKGMGSVYKLSGNRVKPYIVRKTLGFVKNPVTGKFRQQYTIIGYAKTLEEGLDMLNKYSESDENPER